MGRIGRTEIERHDIDIESPRSLAVARDLLYGMLRVVAGRGRTLTSGFSHGHGVDAVLGM
jgi:hypothetical protein